MISPRVPRSQRGFIQYIILGLVLLVAAGAIAFLQHRHAPNDLTASLTGTGGVTITTPDNNSTVTSPVQVTANVAAGFTGPVRTMEVFRDNTLVYQGPGTSVNTSEIGI
jgi:Bacterial Ig domain